MKGEQQGEQFVGHGEFRGLYRGFRVIYSIIAGYQYYIQVRKIN